MTRTFLLRKDDTWLKSLADDFCRAEDIDADLSLGAVIVDCETDECGHPVIAVGVSQQLMRIDYPIFHFSTVDSGERLIERNRAYLEDSSIPAGIECLIHVPANSEKRCPQWKEFLKGTGAKQSHRWSVQL